MTRYDPYQERLGTEPDWYERTIADLAVLERAAGRLRWVGWLWVLGSGLTLLLGMVFLGLGVAKAGAAFVILSFILFVPSISYFVLARFVRVGRRWAIALAILLVSAFTAIVVWRIMVASKVHAVNAVVEVLYLVAALNLIKNLVQGWGAAKRIERQRRRLKEGQPIEEEYA